MSDFVLLNSGDFVLLNSGDKVLLNEAVAAGGVDVQGTHALPVIGVVEPRPKPRIKEFELTAIGKITRNSLFHATARLRRVLDFAALSKIIKPVETFFTANSKITRAHGYLAEATTYSADPQKELEWNRNNTIDRYVKESKVRKLKDLYDMYSDIDEF